MAHDRNLFDRRLRVLRELDDARQAGIAFDDAPEQIAKDALDLAVDQIVDLEFVEPISLFQLPRAGAADDDRRSVSLYRRGSEERRGGQGERQRAAPGH